MYNSCSSDEMKLKKQNLQNRYNDIAFAFDAMEKCAKTSKNDNDTGRDSTTGF